MSSLCVVCLQPGPVVSAAVASGCPVAAVNAAGSNLYLQQDAPPPVRVSPQNADLATVALPIHVSSAAAWSEVGAAACPFAGGGQPEAVTLRLHSGHGPPQEVFGPLCRHSTAAKLIPVNAAPTICNGTILRQSGDGLRAFDDHHVLQPARTYRAQSLSTVNHRLFLQP